MKRDITILSISLVLILAVVNLPAYWFSVSHWFSEPTFGNVTLTDITGTDSLSAYPTTQNANNTILENALNSIVGTTTISTLTTASSLATVGTITTGTWNADAISVAYGGTGSTTLSSNQVLLGNGTSALSVVSGYGTSGQFLTSQGTGSAPVWTTSAIDETGSYNFTGTTFRIKNLFASSTVANPIVLNGVSFSTPTSDGATSTILSTNGSGVLTWNTPQQLNPFGAFLGATTTPFTLTDTTTETVYGQGGFATIPGGYMGSTGAINAKLVVGPTSDSGASDTVTFKMKLGGTTVCQGATDALSTVSVEGYVLFTLYSDGSDSAQSCITEIHLVGTNVINIKTVAPITATVDTSTDQLITFTVQHSKNTGDTETTSISTGWVTFLGR